MAIMTESARLAYNEYIRAWRKSHPDRVREHNRSYWERKAQRMQEEQQPNQTAGTAPAEQETKNNVH